MPRRRSNIRARFDALGPLCDPVTRGALMRAAHQVFDPLWQSGLVSRRRAYLMLARELDMPIALAHMSKLHPVQLAVISDMVAAITYEIHERYRR